jgi:hypothetical protein
VSEHVTPHLGRALAFSTDLKPDNLMRTGNPSLNDALVANRQQGEGPAATHDYCDNNGKLYLNLSKHWT